MTRTHPTATCKGSSKPSHKQNFSRSIKIHLGKLKKFVEDYEEDIKHLDGRRDDSFPPFRNKKEAVEYGRSASNIDMLRVLNLGIYLESKQKGDVKRPPEEKRRNYDFLLFFIQLEQCKESLKAFEKRILMAEEKDPETMLFDEWFDCIDEEMEGVEEE